MLTDIELLKKEIDLYYRNCHSSFSFNEHIATSLNNENRSYGNILSKAIIGGEKKIRSKYKLLVNSLNLAEETNIYNIKKTINGLIPNCL